MTVGVRDPDLSFRLAGDGGEGVISLGELFTLLLHRRGWRVFGARTYPAEIRGGPAAFDLRVGTRPRGTLGDAPDILLAMNPEALALQGKDLRGGGLLLADESAREVDRGGAGRTLLLPFAALAAAAGLPQGKNMTCLGALVRLTNLPLEEAAALIRQRFAAKGAETARRNGDCLAAGWRAMDGALGGTEAADLSGQPAAPPGILLTGNEAVGFGAIAAGCTFFAGYPISPATTIMEFLADKLPCLGGEVLQMEDEMAALAAVLGASFAGRRAMTATSGPGLSLMAELVGLASMAEIPAVVVDVQRAGPATGMPTRTEQSDLHLAARGAHGDGPRCVLAGMDAEDLFQQTLEAFRIAESLQIPVVLLSDQHLASTASAVTLPPEVRVPPAARKLASPQPGTYLRYALSPDGVSPMAVPGTPGCRHTATGLEHGEDGLPTQDPDLRRRMSSKRLAKLGALAQAPGGSLRLDLPGATEGIVSWGSTFHAIREAVEGLAEGGRPVSHLHLRRLHPLPVVEIRAWAGSLDRLVAVEMNATGQLAEILEGTLHRDLERLCGVGGLPFRPGEIAAAVAGRTRP